MRETVKDALLKESMLINTLPQGLKCYIIPKKNYVAKEAMLAVHYGSCDLQYKKKDTIVTYPDGAAHFLEHKMFEEPNGNIFDEFSKKGAMANAFTNFTTTAYYFTSADYFLENLQMLLDFVERPFFTDESVDKEKEIIAQEIKMYDDNPYWKVMLNMLDAMYFEHPVKKNIAGSVESIHRITKDILFDIHANFYNPANMSLICTGDFDPASVIALAEKAMQKQENKKRERFFKEEPDSVKKSIVECKMPLSMPVFQIACKDYPHTEGAGLGKKMLAIKILMDIIAGESSPLYKKLYQEQLAKDSFGFDYVCGEGFAHSVITGYSNEPQKAFHYLIEEIKHLKSKGIDKERFDMIAKKHLGRFIRNFNDIEMLTSMQADLSGREILIFDLIKYYKSFTLDDMTKLLHEHFDYSKMVLSAAYPNS